MAREVVWNKVAVKKLTEIVEYLETEVSEQAAIKFVKNVAALIEKINKYPEIGRQSKTKRTIRQFRIDKNKRLYYRIHGNKLVIVFIFDDRQKPSTNPYS